MLFHTIRLAIAIVLVAGISRASEPQVIRIYLDADQDGDAAAGRAIRIGIETALERTAADLEGFRFELVDRGNRGNVRRSYRNLLEYEADPSALAVFGGTQSPGYLAYREEISAAEILLLLPWSAAGPITRGPSNPNWIFRLSVDDTKVGGFLATKAVVENGCTAPTLLLLNTGWGRANEGTIRSALSGLGIPDPTIIYFDTGTDLRGMRIIARDVAGSSADCVLLVSGAKEGAYFVSALANEQDDVRVFSHWGITVGDFQHVTTPAERAEVGLKFIQTCWTAGPDQQAMQAEVNPIARALFPDEFNRLDLLDAAVGFVHAYDLTLLLVEAIRQVGLGPDMSDNRRRIRDALETLEGPVPGLMKQYAYPFSAEGYDSHEALGSADLCLARFDEFGRVSFRNID